MWAGSYAATNQSSALGLASVLEPQKWFALPVDSFCLTSMSPGRTSTLPSSWRCETVNIEMSGKSQPACVEDQVIHSVIHSLGIYGTPPKLARCWSRIYGYGNESDWQLQTFSLMCQIVNILGFASLLFLLQLFNFAFFFFGRVVAIAAYKWLLTTL